MLYIFNGRGNKEGEKVGKILLMGYTPSFSSIDAINQRICN
jgi:hypothetical protein